MHIYRCRHFPSELFYASRHTSKYWFKDTEFDRDFAIMLQSASDAVDKECEWIMAAFVDGNTNVARDTIESLAQQ